MNLLTALKELTFQAWKSDVRTFSELAAPAMRLVWPIVISGYMQCSGTRILISTDISTDICEANVGVERIT
jgi:hypothetical protein